MTRCAGFCSERGTCPDIVCDGEDEDLRCACDLLQCFRTLIDFFQLVVSDKRAPSEF